MPKASGEPHTYVHTLGRYVHSRVRLHTHACTHTDARRMHRTKSPVWPPPIRLFRCYSLLLSCVIGRARMVAQNNTSKSNTLNRARGSRPIPSNGRIPRYVAFSRAKCTLRCNARNQTTRKFK